MKQMAQESSHRLRAAAPCARDDAKRLLPGDPFVNDAPDMAHTWRISCALQCIFLIV
jgi:hypothetical protein